LVFASLPAPIGTQDLGALFSYSAVAASRPAALVSPFGTIHLATFSFPRPVGTAMPAPAGYRLASLAVSGEELADLFPETNRDAPAPEREFPTIDRRHKGDALGRARASAPPPSIGKPAESEADLAERIDDTHRQIAAFNADVLDDALRPEIGRVRPASPTSPMMDTARLYFAPGSMDAPFGELERAESDSEVPVPAPRPEVAGGETIAGKGEVTGRDKRPMSLAERLGLSVKERTRAEKCLAEAVYFEARGEPVRGQIAVAQVVMNRVFSEHYPDTVCDVVYQNAGRHLACQFTFACDGIPEVVTEADAWRRAKRIAKDTLDGKLWLNDIGKATHYHAYWVRPSWIREMRKMYKLGVHTFYRPRNWGDGSDEPAWGDAKVTARVAKTL
jgi:spore germination cell wall hydrolase CwlJ-like protein